MLSFLFFRVFFFSDYQKYNAVIETPENTRSIIPSF